MFTTVWNYKRRAVFEKIPAETLVTQVPVMSHSEQVAQMIMTGQFMEAYKMGYQFQPGEKIPEDVRIRPGKTADVTTVMNYIKTFGEELTKFKQDTINKNKAAEGVSDVRESTKVESNNEKETPKSA